MNTLEVGEAVECGRVADTQSCAGLDVARLFEQYAPGLLGYLSRRVGTATAEDLVSDTFLVVLRGGGFDPSRGSERAWLFGIATNLMRYHTRSAVRERLAFSLLDSAGEVQADHASEAVSRVDAARDAHNLATALSELRPGDLDVLLLVAWAGLSPTEAGEALGIPPGTARSRLHRLRRNLRTRAAALNTSLAEEELS